MAKKDSLIVGLDIGTTKICAVVGEATPEGIAIVGIGTHPSDGLRKGVVVNIERWTYRGGQQPWCNRREKP
jgi:cell division protein FtsA